MSKNLRLLIIIIILLVCPCILALGAVGLYTYQNQDDSDETKDEEVSEPENAEDLPLKDYTEEWKGQITLAPENASSYTKQVNSDTDCDLPNGVVQYFTEDYERVIVIANKNLDLNAEERKSYNEVLELIAGDEKIMIRDEDPVPTVFRTDCGGAAYTYLEEIDTKYPNTEASNGFVLFGGMHAVASTPEEIPVTVVAYAERGDNVVLVLTSFDGDELFNKTEAETCNYSMDGDTKYLDLDCMKKLYLNSPSKQQIVKDKAETLMHR